MSSSSDLEVASAQLQPAQVQSDPWEPQFHINENPVTSADSVMQNDLAVLAVGRNITMPIDAPIFASMSDAASANGCMILSIRASTAFSNVCDRLWEWRLVIVSLRLQRDELQKKVLALKVESRGAEKASEESEENEGSDS